MNRAAALVSSISGQRMAPGRPGRRCRTPGIKPGMAIARYPEPEEIDCLLRNAELRDEIEPYLTVHPACAR